MNLYFLVEGRVTEKKVYRRWVEHVFPSLSQVQTVAEMTAGSWYIISGYGIPSYKGRIRDALEDIKDNPAVDHFFICIDAEEDPYDARLAEIEAEVRKWETETRVRDHNPSFRVHIIVQNCCVETWFLGHAKMMRRNPSSAVLAEYKRFHDVREEDPELMGAFPGFATRADFHLKYLQEMLLEQNPELRYSKTRPGKVLDKDYLDALRERVDKTGHLRSLHKLFTVWDSLSTVADPEAGR